MDMFAEASQAELEADQSHFDRKYTGKLGCPFLKAKNKVRGFFSREPIVRNERSEFETRTKEKDDRYDRYKLLLDTDNKKFYQDLAALRYRGSKPDLGISAEDRENVSKLMTEKKPFKEILDSAGQIITRNVEALFQDIKNRAQANKDFELETNISMKEVQDAIDELVGGFRNGISNQLEYFRIGALKLGSISKDLQSDLVSLLENNLWILQTSSFLQLGQFRNLLNYFGVKALNFVDADGAYSSQNLKLDDLFEIRSKSDKRFSPILVPKEKFVDKLEADFAKDDTYIDGRGRQSLAEIQGHGKTRGCLVNELTFPNDVKVKFSDIAPEDNDGNAYRLKKTVLLEVAHYANEVLAELVVPTLRKAQPNPDQA
jgi:hypothetical protein